MNVRRGLAIALASIVIAGCGAGSPTPAPSPSVDPAADAAETPLQRAIADVGADGRYTLEAALNLFATIYGPLPGVNVEQDLTGEDEIDGTIAIAAVMGHAAALSPEQRAAIDAYLAPPADAEVITIPPVSETGSRFLLAALDANTRKAYEDAANDFRSQIATKLGRDFASDIKVFFLDELGPKTKFGGRAAADAWSDWPGGVFGDCHIRMFRGGQAGEPVEVLSTLAHEVFHCFQLDAFRTPDSYGIEPAWVVEGQATWVEATLTSGVGCCVGRWVQWLEMQIPLTQRAYDAIGFYGHLDHTGTDPWSIFQPMWNAGSDNVLIFKESGANSDIFLDSWASSVLREPERGVAWDTSGPAITDAAFSPLSHVLRPGGSISISIAALNTLTQYVNLEVDAVHFEVDGHVRVSDGRLDTTDLEDVWFCVEGRDCSDKCESDDEEPPPIDGTIGYVVAVASTGGVDGTTGRMTGIKLKEACETPSPPKTPPATPKPDEPRPCSSGCPMSNGDVHIVTIDDNDYDFQAVGEFVLLRSADGSFELQGRQEPYGNANDISINSGVAMRADGQRIGVYTDPFGETLDVLVDGSPVDPATAPVIVGDTTITYVDAGLPSLEIALGDGTRVMLVGEYQYGINLTINPSDALREGAVGLMGPVPPDSMGVPALPDGTVIPEQFGNQAFEEKLYGEFEEAWRVTPETTLFDYTDGRTTASYLNPDFPVLQELLSYDELTPEQLAAGEAACAGINIEFLRRQCVYDVGVTGVNVFGDLYDISAEIVDSGTIKPAGQRVRVVNFYWDPATGAVPLDVYAWTDAGPALITTVQFGEVSEWFDPGSWTDTFGQREALVSMQRAGQPVVDEAFNLIDEAMDVEPGLERTFIIGTGELDSEFGLNGLPYVTIRDEERPVGLPLMPALPDRGLLFIDLTGLIYTHTDRFKFFTSAGDGCLTQPDFPTLAQESGVENETWAYQGPLAVAPGTDLQLTLHEAEPGNDAFAVLCDTPPIHGPVPFSLEAGERSHLLLYAIPGDPTIRSLILPFGE